MPLNRINLLERAETADGYPNIDFEFWYQQGVSCYGARLPAWLVRQAFRVCFAEWKVAGKEVAIWHIKAFLTGVRGGSGVATHPRHVHPEFKWPEPPPAGWFLVVCAYPNGACEIDYAHPISRAFWSEDHEPFPVPDKVTVFNPWWYKRMGFEMMYMNYTMQVAVAPPSRHLHAVEETPSHG